MPGKYFVIVSRANDTVLDVQGASEEPGAKVIAWERTEAENQLWYVDSTTGTIRSKQTDYCLDVAGSTLVVNPFNAEEPNQRWRFSDDFIRLKDDPEKVCDVTADGTVCIWEAHGGDNQKWHFDYVERRYFFIVSELHGKVLDVSGADSSPGTKVMMWERHDDAEDNQLWYEDKHGVIRSKLNDLVLDTSSGILRTGEPEIGNGYQLWQKQGSQISCKVAPNEVLDIHQGNADDGAEIRCFGVHHGENQCWHFEYL